MYTHLVTVAVTSLTTDTHKYTFPLEIRHSVRDEYVKFPTLNVKAGRSSKTLVNS